MTYPIDTELCKMVNRLATRIEAGEWDQEDDHATARDFLESAAAISWVTSMNLSQCQGEILLITGGGPTVEVDTADNRVRGTWGASDYSRRYCTTDHARELDETLEELFEMQK